MREPPGAYDRVSRQSAPLDRSVEDALEQSERSIDRWHTGAVDAELSAGDLVIAAAGPEDAVVHADRLGDLRRDAARDLGDGAVEAAEAVREAWRALEEFNLNAPLALEAPFIRLRRAFAGSARPVSA